MAISYFVLVATCPAEQPVLRSVGHHRVCIAPLGASFQHLHRGSDVVAGTRNPRFSQGYAPAPPRGFVGFLKRPEHLHDRSGEDKRMTGIHRPPAGLFLDGDASVFHAVHASAERPRVKGSTSCRRGARRRSAAASCEVARKPAERPRDTIGVCAVIVRPSFPGEAEGMIRGPMVDSHRRGLRVGRRLVARNQRRHSISIRLPIEPSGRPR